MRKKLLSGAIIILAIVGITTIGILTRKNMSGIITLTGIYEHAQICSIITIMKELNLLEKHLPENVNVEWSMIDGGADRRDALATERASIAVIDNVRVITAIENDYPIIVLANGSGSMSGLYTINPEIVSPKDLEGKKIAHQGATVALTLKSDLRTNFGVSLADYQLLAVGEQEVINMLIQNQVDAAIMTSGIVAKAVALRPEVREFYDLTPETMRLGITNWLIGSSRFFEKHPELLDPVMSAYREAVGMVNDDPAGIAKLLSPLFGIDASQIEKEFRAFPPVIEVYGYDELARILYDNGDLDVPAKPFDQLQNYEKIPKK